MGIVPPLCCDHVSSFFGILLHTHLTDVIFACCWLESRGLQFFQDLNPEPKELHSFLLWYCGHRGVTSGRFRPRASDTGGFGALEPSAYCGRQGRCHQNDVRQGAQESQLLRLDCPSAPQKSPRGMSGDDANSLSLALPLQHTHGCMRADCYTKETKHPPRDLSALKSCGLDLSAAQISGGLSRPPPEPRGSSGESHGGNFYRIISHPGVSHREASHASVSTLKP